jgi:hypothetical protein
MWRIFSRGLITSLYLLSTLAISTLSFSAEPDAEPDPEAWTIADGKLYVFGKKRGPSVFAEERQEIVANAAQNWRDLQNR